MKKKINAILMLFFSSISFGQTYSGEIVNNQNDTIKKVEIIINKSTVFNYNRIISLQEKIKVIQNNVETEYLPKDLKSFRIYLDKKIYIFDNVDNLFFAERMYVGKVSLHKLIRKTYVYPNTNTFRYYLIKRPNDEKISEMIAMGFSRLITKNTMLPVIADCKVSYDKIENDEFKIKDEEKLIEFIKDYEKNCFL
jgi:hypothetical protein